MRENPFAPLNREISLCLAGRRSAIEHMARASEVEQRRPELTTIFSGARGSGYLDGSGSLEPGISGVEYDTSISVAPHAGHCDDPGGNGAPH